MKGITLPIFHRCSISTYIPTKIEREIDNDPEIKALKERIFFLNANDSRIESYIDRIKYRVNQIHSKHERNN